MQLFRLVLFSSLFIVCLSPLNAQTVEGLQQSFAGVQKAIQEKDLDGLLRHFDKDAVLYLRNEIYPIDRSDYTEEGFRKIFEDWFARIYSAGFTRVNVDYRIFGETGLLWGEGRFAQDARDGTGSDRDRRLTVVFVWVDNQWKIVLWNGAPPPIGIVP